MSLLRKFFGLAVRYWHAKGDMRDAKRQLEQAEKDFEKAERDLKNWDDAAEAMRNLPRELPQRLKDLMFLNAAANGDTQTVSSTLKAGADVHAMNDVSVVLAAFNRHLDTVIVLKQAGVDVHALNDHAIKTARRRGDAAMLEILEKKL
jgi:hypothetical protein